MSWLFSRALVEEFSAGTCSDGARSALLSGSPTPQAFLPSDKMTAFSRPSRFGMTFSPLTDDLGADVLTWFLAGFPAKTSASQARAQASAANAPACGLTWRGSLARFDLASSSWRTVQPSLLGDSDECSVTWPRSGMTADGQCWELPMSGRRTSATDSGLWPTPNALPASNDLNLQCSGDGRTKPNKLGWAVAVSKWPTPVASDTSSRSKPYAQGGTPLSLAVKWPTPTAVTSSGGAALCKWGGSGSREMLKKIVTPTELNGALNPTWVEWLMGWPLGWTDLEPLATDKYLCAQPKHSEPSQVNSEVTA